MAKGNIIISESPRPFWQLPVAALFFTLAIALIILQLTDLELTPFGFKKVIYSFEIIVLLISFGVGFSSKKTIYVDLKSMIFRPTLEIGPLKLGKWIKILHPEYVSVFLTPKADGFTSYEINLWHNRNMHLELFERDNYVDAFRMAFELSQELELPLLDSTIPNNFQWVDKEATKDSGKIIYTD